MPELDALPGSVTVQPSVPGAGASVRAADGAGETQGGVLELYAGYNATGTAGGVTIQGGVGAGVGAVGGSIVQYAGNGGDTGGGVGGNFTIIGGTGGAGGQVLIEGGGSTDDFAAGSVTIEGGPAVANGAAGDVVLITGAAFGLGRNGLIILMTDPSTPGLPTSDPHVAGALWSSTGTVKISAGP